MGVTPWRVHSVEVASSELLAASWNEMADGSARNVSYLDFMPVHLLTTPFYASPDISSACSNVIDRPSAQAAAYASSPNWIRNAACVKMRVSWQGGGTTAWVASHIASCTPSRRAARLGSPCAATAAANPTM